MADHSTTPVRSVRRFVALGLVCFALPSLASEVADLQALKADYQRPDAIPFPADNAWSPAREALGEALFFDPRLSGSGSISCATCHDPALAFGDGRPKGIGHDMTPLDRRTPTVLDTAWATSLFWDGRASTLEEQALGPIASAAEMNLPLEQMEARLAEIEGYAAMFEAAYPGEPVDRTSVARAIATYERTVVSGEAPFDRWVAGDDTAISAQAVRGFEVFNTTGGCASCHSGWRFTDDSFHDIGIDDDDLGRGALIPGIPEIEHAFKTPTLREATLRAPYMHNGSLATLSEVVDYYDRGGDTQRAGHSDKVRPLGLTDDDKAALVAFMETLTGELPETPVPTLPR